MNSFDHLIKASTTGFFVFTKTCPSFSLFDSKNTSPIRTYSQKPHNIEAMVVSPTHNTLLSLPYNKSLLCLYSVNSNTPYLKCGTVEKFTSGTTTKSGDFCLFGSVHGNVFVFNSVSGVMLGTFKVSSKTVRFMETSECGLFTLIACEDNQVYLYKVQEMISSLMMSVNHQSKTDMLREMVKDVLKTSVSCKWKKNESYDYQQTARSTPKDFLYGRKDDFFNF